MTFEQQEQLRQQFEELIAHSTRWRFSTPLNCLLVNDRFHHYMDPDTDTLWLGFLMGVNATNRLADKRRSILSLLTQRKPMKKYAFIYVNLLDRLVCDKIQCDSVRQRLKIIPEDLATFNVFDSACKPGELMTTSSCEIVVCIL